jgi:hypothetical protein
MGFNANATIIPGKGTVLVAPPDTAAPDYELLDPTSPSGGWVALGHTSRDNNVALSKGGGDATQRGSWWDDALRSTYDPITWSVNVNSIQIDSTTLGLAFGGGTHSGSNGTFDVGGTITPQKKALFILIVDGSTRMGIYIPNTTITIGDAPQIAVDAFFEITLTAQMLNSETTGNRFRFYHPGLITVAPAISTALPSGQGTGQVVALVGTGFVGITGVTVGGVAASFTVNDTKHMDVTLPSGSAGSAPIIVTGINGASNSQAYTRAA